VLKILAKYVSEHMEQKTNLPTSPNLSNPTIPPNPPIKTEIEFIKNNQKKLDLVLNLPIKVSSNDKDGILECEGYGSNWPYKVICEFEIPEKLITSINSITGTFVATDQGWGGTGHDNVRYRVGSNKISPAFFIDRDKNPSNTYTFTIKKDELNGLTSQDKITFWLCSAPWGGWSAHLTSCEVIIS
jgi:hypothetical protein